MQESGIRRADSLRQDILVETQIEGIPLRLHSRWGLFSPREIDAGTRLLLRQLTRLEPDQKGLDLGCGYGPIGLYLAARQPEAAVTLVDRDFVAVALAAENAVRNGLLNTEALLSDGFSALAGRRFDLVASNLPAKVGREMLRILVEDAFDHLLPGGRFQAVILSGLRETLRRDLAEVFGSARKLKQGPKHVVLEAMRPSEAGTRMV
jgi:16S rRNA G1207 methylase RsmC